MKGKRSEKPERDPDKLDMGLIPPAPGGPGPLEDPATHTDDDGGEGVLSGRSREHHPEIPDEVRTPDEVRSNPDET